MTNTRSESFDFSLWGVVSLTTFQPIETINGPLISFLPPSPISLGVYVDESDMREELRHLSLNIAPGWHSLVPPLYTPGMSSFCSTPMWLFMPYGIDSERTENVLLNTSDALLPVLDSLTRGSTWMDIHQGLVQRDVSDSPEPVSFRLFRRFIRTYSFRPTMLSVVPRHETFMFIDAAYPTLRETVRRVVMSAWLLLADTMHLPLISLRREIVAITESAILRSTTNQNVNSKRSFYDAVIRAALFDLIVRRLRQPRRFWRELQSQLDVALLCAAEGFALPQFGDDAIRLVSQFTNQAPGLVNFLKQWLLWLGAVHTSESSSSFYMACFAFVANTTTLAHLESCRDFIMSQWRDLVDNMSFLWEEEPQSLSSDVFTASSEIRKFLAGADMVHASPLMQKCVRCVLQLACCPIGEVLGLTPDRLKWLGIQGVDRAMKNPGTTGFSVIRATLDFLTFLYNNAFQYLTAPDSSMEVLLHGADSYGSWWDLRKSVIDQSVNLTPESTPKFSSELEKALSIGEGILKRLRMSRAPETVYMTKYMEELYAFRDNLNLSEAQSKLRVPPFALLISGAPGCGKSDFRDQFFHYFAALRDLPNEAKYLYSRNTEDTYWNGFKSWMWCISYDDLAQEVPTRPTAGKDIGEILRINNCTPYVVNQAFEHEKGKNHAAPKLLLGTTNVGVRSKLSAHGGVLSMEYWYRATAAGQRRFKFHVDMEVKKEFRPDNGADTLDASKLYDGAQPHNFRLYTVDVVTEGKVDFRELGFYNDRGTLFLSLRKFIDDHFEKETHASHLREERAAETFCSVCTLPASLHHGDMCDGTVSVSDIVSLGSDDEDAVEWSAQDLKISGTTDFPHEDPVKPQMFHGAPAVGVYSTQEKLVMAAHATRCYVYEKGSKIGLVSPARRDRAYRESVQAAVRIAGAPSREMFLKLGVRMCSDIFASLPRKIRDFVSTHRRVVAAVSAGLLLAYALRPSLVKPQESINQGQKVWVSMADKYSARKDMVTSMKTAHTPDQMESRLRANMRLIRFVREGSLFGSVHALGVGGSVYLTVHHPFEMSDTHHIELREFSSEPIKMVRSYKIDHKMIWKFPGKDLCLIVLPGPALREVSSSAGRNYFAPSPHHVTGKVQLYHSRAGTLGFSEAQAGLHPSGISYKVKTSKGPVTCQAPITYSPVTTAGDCGAPIIAEVAGRSYILGIHTCGSSKVSGGEFVLAPEIEEGKTHLQNLWVDADGSGIRLTHEVGPMHRLSDLAGLEGSGQIVGSAQGVHPIRRKSKVVPTLISNPKQATKTAPLMRNDVQKHLYPMEQQIKKVVEINDQLDIPRARECADAFYDDVKHTASDLKGPLSLKETINGIHGCQYIDGIKMNTSTGYPWNRPKTEYTVLVSEDPHERKLVPEILEEFNLLHETAKSGKAIAPVFTAHLKDEIVSFEKRKLGKTRMFCGCPFPAILLIRMYFLSVVKLIQENRFTFECAVGMNVASDHWTKAYHYVTKFGKDRIVGGDYSAFDKSMPSEVIRLAFSIMIRLAEASGRYSETDLRVMRVIGSTVSSPVILVGNTIFQALGSNPSGHPLTVIVNSLVNSIYMRMPFQRVREFKSHVTLLTYGDDNIMGVSRHVTDYDHTKVAAYLAKQGIKYTMPDKESDSVPFSPITSLDFLKRRWVQMEGHPDIFVAPLAESSIYGMLNHCVASDVATQEEQMRDIAESAYREWWHYGKERFDIETKDIAVRLIAKGLTHLVPKHTWYSLLADHVDRGDYPSLQTEQE